MNAIRIGLASLVLLGGISAVWADESAEKLAAALKDLQSDDRNKIDDGSRAIEKMGADAKSAIPDLIKILEQNRPENRRHVMALLIPFGVDARPALPALRTMLKSDDFHTQYWSCRVIARIGPEAKEATDDLLKIAADENSTASVKRNAAIALGAIGTSIGEKGVNVLTGMLRDRAQPVRVEAAGALSQLGDLAKPALPLLREAARNPDRHMRVAAALSVWRLTRSTEDVLDPLVAELSDLDAPWEAAAALSELGAAAAPAVPTIRKQLKSENAELRLYAAEALGNIGPAAKAAIPDLQRLAQNSEEDEEVVTAAKAALKAIQPEQTGDRPK